MPGLTATGRRRFTNEDKRQFVRAWHEAAGVRGERAALLRSWRVDMSMVKRWVQADAEGKLGPVAKLGRLDMASKERARLIALEQENARLRRKVEQAEAAMTIMGKAQELLQQSLESEPPQHQVPPALMSVQEYQTWLEKYGIS